MRNYGSLLLASAAILLVAWSLVVPIYEAPDEPAHWAYAQYLHEYQQLPVYSPAQTEGMRRRRITC